LEYEEDAQAFAWAVLGYLSLDSERASAINVAIAKGDTSNLGEQWPKPSFSELISSLEAARELSCAIAQRVYATRAKDWTNPFRKTTFRNENEQLAVHGRIEDNSAIKDVSREMESIGAEIDRLISRLLKSDPKASHPQDGAL